MEEPGTIASDADAPARVSVVTGTHALQLVLLGATLLTTIRAGALHQGQNLLKTPAAWPLGLPYALALLAILAVHEMGHYVMARRRRVRASLPYFIPAPIWLGTFGAFIRLDGPVRNRAAYFDVGIAGPLAGLLVALAALFFGFRYETAVMAHDHGLWPGSSLLMAGVFTLAGGADLSAPLQLGPVGFAGWLGLIVTGLNLLPVGQLDGGHVAYAVLGRRVARRVSFAFIGLLVVGGLLAGSHLWMWGLFAWLIAGTEHPPAGDDETGVGNARILLSFLGAVVLLLILIPVPGV